MSGNLISRTDTTFISDKRRELKENITLLIREVNEVESIFNDVLNHLYTCSETNNVKNLIKKIEDLQYKQKNTGNPTKQYLGKVK